MVVPPQQASEEALIGLNRLVTAARLLSGAVHEVNNALQVITGTIEILQGRRDLPAPVSESLAVLQGQSHRATGALVQIMHFTRASRGEHALVNVRELALESLALRDFAIRRARLSARLVAEGATPFLVIGNRGDLQQVLLNMLMNAEQALSGTTGAIEVQLTAGEGSVSLRVVDEGPGIGLDPPERAFHAFVSTYDASEAAGLGLWAARLLVEQHGGTLTAETRPMGAAFVMRLPLASAAKGGIGGVHA